MIQRLIRDVAYPCQHRMTNAAFQIPSLRKTNSWCRWWFGGGRLSPFVGKFPYLGYIHWLSNTRFFQLQQSCQVSMTQRTVHGLSFVMGYTFAHRPWGVSRQLELHQRNGQQEYLRSIYGTTEFDVTHSVHLSRRRTRSRGMKTPGQAS